MSLYCWFISTNRWTTVQRPCLNGAHKYTHFLGRHIAAYLHFGSLDGTSTLCLGAILNSKIPKKKPPKCKTMALSKPRQGPLFTVWELRGTRSQKVRNWFGIANKFWVYCIIYYIIKCITHKTYMYVYK